MKEITGRLENWSWDLKFPIIWGFLYDDIHKRWRDGQMIHTSSIDKKKFRDVKEGDIVETMNSRYLLGKPSEVIKNDKTS